MIDADFARELTKSNEERQNIIKDFIERGEEQIEYYAKKGRRRTFVTYGKGCNKYQEVLEHFTKLGFKIGMLDNTNVCEIKW